MRFYGIRHISPAFSKHIHHSFIVIQNRFHITSCFQKAFIIPDATIITASQYLRLKIALFIIVNSYVFIFYDIIAFHIPPLLHFAFGELHDIITASSRKLFIPYVKNFFTWFCN